jgi:predicted O-methyltransferase YrrM
MFMMRPQKKLMSIAFKCREVAANSRLGLLASRCRHGSVGKYIWLSRRVPGFTPQVELAALARWSASLPADATIVEIGSFLGRSAITLAGARKTKGSGKVHCIDAFDASGDPFSVFFYREIKDSMGASLRQQFDANVRAAGLSDWIVAHQADGREYAKSWTEPIDLLFMDADHSYPAVLAVYEGWSKFLRPGGILAVHNTLSQVKGHDGSRRLVAEKVKPPNYSGITQVLTTTFARKSQMGSPPAHASIRNEADDPG